MSSRTAAPRDPAVGQGVGRDLLGDERGEEVVHPEVVALLLGPGGHLEERADRVEVSVGPAGLRPAEVDQATQPLGPVGARPQVPEHLLGRGAVVELGAGAGAAVRPGTGARRPRGPRGRRGSPPRPRARRNSSRDVRGDVSRRARVPSRAAQLARRARAGRRRRARPAAAEQQRLGPAGVEVVDVVEVVVVEVDHRAQGVEQRQHRGVAHQRHFVGGDLDRYAGRAERAAQRRDGGASRAHQHRHLVPGDAVLEVCAPEQVGEVLGLGPLGVEGAHHAPGRPRAARSGGRARERLAGPRRDAAGQRQPAGHPLRGERAGCGPNRRVVRSATTVGRRPSLLREARAGSRGCRGPRPHGSRRSTGADRPRR